MINETEFENFAFKFALENAHNYGGKANPKALIGKIMPQFPEMKKDMAHYMQLIENIVKQVNDMDGKTQKRKLLDMDPDFLKKKDEKKENNKKPAGLIDLPGLKGEFAGRFAPAPSGYLHIGHALNIVYNYEYKKKYGGQFLLRFEDTNPEKIDIKNYDKIIEDVKWLTEDGVDKVYYQSDRLPTYYKYLRQLIETGHAYVCECEAEVFKAYNDSAQACPHREREVERQMHLYDKFFRKEKPYQDGEAVIRFKGDLKNKNPALRDIPIARMNSTPHARVGTKYKLWPMYNFCVAIDDALMGITYVVRGKDAEIGAIRQDKIKDALGLKKCPYYHFGLVQFTDIEIGKTPIKEKIQKGVYTGWDDPRVPTLVSFKKRGFKPKAFREMIKSFGISKRGYKLSEKEYFKSINYFNKQILEKEADRYFFVTNPKTVEITNISKYPEKEILLPKHPDFKERGSRKISIVNKYRIDGIDFKNIKKGDTIRLMHFANFKVTDKTEDNLKLEYISKEYDKNLKLARNIQFVPYAHGEHKHVEIVMQDNSRVKGMCEALNNPKIDTALQFERFGFVRLDEIKEDGTRVFYFTHR